MGDGRNIKMWWGECDGRWCRTSQWIDGGWRVLYFYTRRLIAKFSPRYLPKAPPKWFSLEDDFYSLLFLILFLFFLDFIIFLFFCILDLYPCKLRHKTFLDGSYWWAPAMDFLRVWIIDMLLICNLRWWQRVLISWVQICLCCLDSTHSSNFPSIRALWIGRTDSWSYCYSSFWESSRTPLDGSKHPCTTHSVALAHSTMKLDIPRQW